MSIKNGMCVVVLLVSQAPWPVQSCDGLKLASASRLERLFLFTNDDDFIPFCRTIKEFGANISIIHLSETITRNLSLLREADSYDVIPKANLQTMFLPQLEAMPPDVSAAEVEAPVSAQKPETSPSDMAVESASVATGPVVPEDGLGQAEESNKRPQGT